MRRLVGSLLVVALVAAGCGDDAAEDSSETTSTTTDAGADDPVISTAPAGSQSTTSSSVVDDIPADETPPDDALEGDPLVVVADLDPAAEVPGPGQAGAAGRVEIEATTDDELCVDMVVTGLASAVTAAHIHEAPAGSAGSPVLTIGPPSTDGDPATWTDVCVAAEPELIERLAGATDQFYVNVHTAEFPDGAVRGQLELSSIFDLELS